MRAKKRWVLLAVLCLGSLAGAVHAKDAWRKTIAVAVFPGVDDKDEAVLAQATAPAPIAEGTDLKREFGPRRSAHAASAGLPELLANPYDATAGNDSLPLAHTRGFDKRADETGSDERWSNPYAVARNTDNDERWANPYGAVRNVAGDERWSNPYAPSVRR